jgi:hypothetical protein
MGFIENIDSLEQVPRFEVVKEPLFDSRGQHDGVFALQRSDTNAHLGSCGENTDRFRWKKCLMYSTLLATE